jgi:hypothetical protein
MNLEELPQAQAEMQERQIIARSKHRKAGSRKKKPRTRTSIKILLVKLAESHKTASKVRAWAIQQLLLLGGKPVQPFEEIHDEPESNSEPPAPVFRGADLGSPKTGLSLDAG